MQYYYLISGLPDLHLDMEPRHIDFEETYDTIERNLSDSDLVAYRYLLYANDNRNILVALFEEAKGRKLTRFVQPSAFTEEEMRDYRHKQSRFPSYLSQFLEVYADQISELPLGQMSERLEQHFLEEVHELGDNFLSEWFDFDRTLKAILATYNSSKYAFLSAPPVMTDGVLSKHIGVGKTISSTLSKSYPYLEALIEVLEANDPRRLERAVDRIRWTFLEHFAGFFGRQQVYSYALKLMMVQRNYVLRQNVGEGHLITIMDDIKKISREPQTARI